MAHHRDRDFEPDDSPAFQRFSRRSAGARRTRMVRTALLRTDLEAADVESLPVGRVVKVFGLWNVTQENLMVHFPDVVAGTVPLWRQESCRRIADSLPET